MRTLLSSLVPFTAAAALLAAPVRPAAAQAAATPTSARPDVAPAAAVPPAVPPAVRPIVTYTFRAWRDAFMPIQVTVADSAGELVGSFVRQGDRTRHPMLVTVIGTDLVLQGQTPAGVITFHLYQQDDLSGPRAIDGRWWLGGEEQGELRGRLVR